MKKNLALLFAIATLAACKSEPAKRGAINLGAQTTAITLASGDNNDVDLMATHASLGSIIRFTPASGGSTLTGLVSTQFDDGDLFMLRNDSTTDSLTLANARTSATANQFLLSSAGDVVLPPRSSVWIEFDKTAAKWVQGPGHINSPTFNGTISTTLATAIGGGIETLDGTTGKIIAATTKQTSYLSFSGTKAFTMPDGTTTGMVHRFEVTGATSSPLGTLTITTPTGTESATHVFTAVGQILELQWDGTGWHVVGKKRSGHQTLVIGTTLTAGLDMALTYDLSVTGAVSSSTTKALPNGSVPGEICHIDVTTAATSAAGQLFFTGTSATGVGVGSAVNIGNGATDKSFVLALVWDGAAWQIIYTGTNTGVTIAWLDALDQFYEVANDNIVMGHAA